MSPTGKLRILLADDHPIVRGGTRLIIENEADMRVVGEAGNGEELLELAQDLDFELALVDVNMPKLNGIRAVQQLKKLKPAAKVIILTGFLNEGYIQASAESGMDGYLVKECSPTELILAIRMAMAGHQIFPKQPGQVPIVSSLKERPTPQELNVLKQLNAGLSNKEIAAHMNLTERTVEYHLSNLYTKLSVTSRVEAIKKSNEKGWLLEF